MMAQNTLSRFFGGAPGWVLFRLVLLSLIVGVVLSALNLDALKILDGCRDLVRGILDLGVDAFESVFRYFLLGAAIVFPIWLVLRLLSYVNRDRA